VTKECRDGVKRHRVDSATDTGVVVSVWLGTVPLAALEARDVMQARRISESTA